MKGWKRGKRGIKWWEKGRRGMVSTLPFLEGHLLLASRTFFQPVSKEKKKKNKRGNEGWGDEGEGKEERGMITQKDGLKQSHEHKYNLMTL